MVTPSKSLVWHADLNRPVSPSASATTAASSHARTLQEHAPVATVVGRAGGGVTFLVPPRVRPLRSALVDRIGHAASHDALDEASLLSFVFFLQVQNQRVREWADAILRMNDARGSTREVRMGERPASAPNRRTPTAREPTMRVCSAPLASERVQRRAFARRVFARVPCSSRPWGTSACISP